MIDHDAIAARVRQDRETGTPGPWHHDADDKMRIDYTDPRSGTCWNVAHVHSHCGRPVDGSSANARRIAALPDLEEAYLDLYNEVKRLRKFMQMIVDDRDRTFVRLAERAEEAEAERDRLRAALSQIAHGRERIDISYREFLDEFVRPLAREALKGDSDE